jgi:hypothetical protein
MRATRGSVCAGWAEAGGRVVACAPILARQQGPDMAARLRRQGWRVEVVSPRTLTPPPES